MNLLKGFETEYGISPFVNNANATANVKFNASQAGNTN
jgi:hypothetical protein